MSLATTRKRSLTKEQKFNLEMIYKPMFFSLYDNKLVIDHLNVADIKRRYDLFLMCFVRRLGTIFAGNSKGLYDFLDEYKENLCWADVLKNIAYETHIDLRNNNRENITLQTIIPKYSQYFNSKCWNYISQKFYHGDEDLIREYKDKLNWNHLSKHYNFRFEFMKEMIDYINLKHFFNQNNTYLDSMKSREKIFEFIKDHINEVE